MWGWLLILLLFVLLLLYAIKHSGAEMPPLQKFVRQAHIIRNPSVNEGDIYRAIDVKDGPLVSEPFPGVKTLFDLFK